MLTVVVVGGGFSGLQTAIWLAGVRPTVQVVLFEALSRCGGRAKTTFEKDGPVRYERGPWRVLDTQSLSRDLVQRFGCRLETLSHDMPGALRRFPKAFERTSAEGPIEGLSDWDNDVMDTNIPTADERDRSSGYAGIRRSEAAGSNAYNVSSLNAHPSGSFVVEGFEALAQRMADFLDQQANVRLYTNTRVLEISRDGTYKIAFQRRLESGQFEEEQIRSDVVVLAVPPSLWHEFLEVKTVLSHVELLTYLVTAHPLARAYAKVAQELEEILGTGRYHIISPSSATAQLISPNYGNEWAAVAYVGSEEAWLLRRLELNAGKKALGSFICRELCVLLDSHGISAGSKREKKLLRGLERTVDLCFTATAVHSWLPNPSCPDSPQFRKRMARRCVLTPHRTRLPGFFVVGEAFSTKQGWIEGALQTSRWLERHWPVWLSGQWGRLPRQMRNMYVFYDGRRIDVSSWKDQHPGGAMALLHHLNEDITKLMAHILHPPYALATLWYLQQGWE